MKPIKLHLTSAFTSYGLLRNDVFYSPIICSSFVQGCLNATSQNITLWVVPSKNGNIVIGKPYLKKEHHWSYSRLGWKWYGQRLLQPLHLSLGEMLEPGRYNVYISEGWA
jgi:hypothetical protein